MKKIFLVGFMGCGKTTLSDGLSATYGISTVDLDDYIEAKAGMSIRRYFELYGESAFRNFERTCLEEVVDDPAISVVACGGGTACYSDNIDFMNRVGGTVFLYADDTVLIRRLKEGRAKRPLIANLNDDELCAFVKERVATRLPFYSKAKFRFDSSHLETEEEVVKSAKDFFELFIEN